MSGEEPHCFVHEKSGKNGKNFQNDRLCHEERPIDIESEEDILDDHPKISGILIPHDVLGVIFKFQPLYEFLLVICTFFRLEAMNVKSIKSKVKVYFMHFYGLKKLRMAEEKRVDDITRIVESGLFLKIARRQKIMVEVVVEGPYIKKTKTFVRLFSQKYGLSGCSIQNVGFAGADRVLFLVKILIDLGGFKFDMRKNNLAELRVKEEMKDLKKIVIDLRAPLDFFTIFYYNKFFRWILMEAYSHANLNSFFEKKYRDINIRTPRIMPINLKPSGLDIIYTIDIDDAGGYAPFKHEFRDHTSLLLLVGSFADSELKKKDVSEVDSEKYGDIFHTKSMKLVFDEKRFIQEKLFCFRKSAEKVDYAARNILEDDRNSSFGSNAVGENEKLDEEEIRLRNLVHDGPFNSCLDDDEYKPEYTLENISSVSRESDLESGIVGMRKELSESLSNGSDGWRVAEEMKNLVKEKEEEVKKIKREKEEVEKIKKEKEDEVERVKREKEEEVEKIKRELEEQKKKFEELKVLLGKKEKEGL